MYSRSYRRNFIAITGITAIADEVLLARERRMTENPLR